LTAQPLFNYLVAMIYTEEDIDFSQDIDLNRIHFSFLRSVYDRASNPNRQGFLNEFSFPAFVYMLEEIGLTVWQGDGKTTIRDVLQRCEQMGIVSLLKQFHIGAEAGITRLLTAFFSASTV
ncbi:MAG: hypothetical protein AAFY41_17075, partial [Bacteroidota bacterium]